jgi:hypothetical protein
MKQTAIEWLESELKKLPMVDVTQVFQQAKVMDKEQKKLMFDCGRQYQLTGEGTFTQVYNEIYGK